MKSHLLSLREPVRQHVTSEKDTKKKSVRISLYFIAYLITLDQTSLPADIFSFYSTFRHYYIIYKNYIHVVEQNVTIRYICGYHYLKMLSCFVIIACKLKTAFFILKKINKNIRNESKGTLDAVKLSGFLTN